MEFLNPDPALTEVQIKECETACGLRLPQALRETYLSANGGRPNPYVFEKKIDTAISQFLPLMTKVERRETALDVYQDLVLERAIVPITYFPFAVDGGGDYFFPKLQLGTVPFISITVMQMMNPKHW
jgi:hypothetical protein